MSTIDDDEYLRQHKELLSDALEHREFDTAVWRVIQHYLRSRELNNGSGKVVSLFYLYTLLDRLFPSRKTEIPKQIEEFVCSFCMRPSSKGDIVAGPKALICRSCIKTSSELLPEE